MRPVKKRYPRYRRATVGKWLLLGKLPVSASCFVCDRKLKGEHLVYVNTVTGKKIVVGTECVKKFEMEYSNPGKPRPKCPRCGKPMKLEKYWYCFYCIFIFNGFYFPFSFSKPVYNFYPMFCANKKKFI